MNIPQAFNGTEQRLDAILFELRAIRARIESVISPQPSPDELREPYPPRKRR